MSAEGPPFGAGFRRPGMLVWLTALAAWLAFAPLRLRQGAVGFQLEPSLDEEFVGHLVLLVPLATALAAAAGRAREGWGVVGRAVGLAVLAGVVLEAGQFFVDDRALSPFDFAAGVLGALPAIALTRLAMRRGLDADAILRVLLVVMVAAAFVSVGLSARAHNVELFLADWNPKHVVVAADEYDAPNRAYAGEVTDARICAGRDGDRVCVGDGADAESRRRVVQAAEDSQYVELTAAIISESDEQAGPSRIMTFSWGPYGRNVSLMQHQRSLILRVRTPRTGPNGTLCQFVLPRVVDRGVPLHVTASFDHGRIAIGTTAADGSGRTGTYAAPFHATLLSRGRRAVRAPYVLRGRALTAATLVLFAGLGLAAVTFTRLSARTLLLAACPVAVGLMWLLGVTWWASPAPQLFEHVATCVAALAGTLLGLWDR